MKLQEYTASAHNFEQCMKCTVCTAYCPVVPANPRYPGPKQAGPDGERLRLKDPYFFDEALKYCLNCKRCEVACPSGVNVADIIQAARIKYSKSKPKLRDRILASTDFMGSLARPFAPLVNGMTGLGATKAVLDATMAIDKNRTFPKYASKGFEGWFKRNAAAKQAAFKEHVAYFHGCYVNYNFPQLGKDFVTVLNAFGIGVELLDKEKCCGVAMISNGMIREAKKHAVHNVGVLGKAVALHDAGRVSGAPRDRQRRRPRQHPVGYQVSVRADRRRRPQTRVQEGLQGPHRLPHPVPPRKARLGRVLDGTAEDDPGRGIRPHVDPSVEITEFTKLQICFQIADALFPGNLMN